MVTHLYNWSLYVVPQGSLFGRRKNLNDPSWSCGNGSSSYFLYRSFICERLQHSVERLVIQTTLIAATKSYSTVAN